MEDCGTNTLMNISSVRMEPETKAAFCKDKCDRYDYLAAVGCGVMSGLVDIFLDGEKAGKITASFQVKSDRISGTIVTSEEETAKQIEEHLQELQDAMQEPADIHVAYTPDLSLSQFEMSGIRRESEMKEQGELEKDRSNQVQTTRLYHTAEVFINSIKSLLTKTKDL